MIKILGILVKTLFIICLITLLACSNAEERKAKHYRKGLEYLDNGDARSAILEFRNVVELDSKFADAYYRMGLAYLELESPENAYNNFEKAIKIDPNNLDALLKSAEMLFLVNELEESQKLLDQILNIDPDYVNGLILGANIALLNKEIRRAEILLERAQKLKPNLDRIYRTKAKLLVVKKRYSGIEELLLKAVALAPENEENHDALVAFYLSSDDLDKAESLLKLMISSFPESAKNYMDLANIFMKKGEPKNAEEAVQSAIANNPTSSDLHIFQGELYKRVGKYDRTEAVYKQAIVISKQPLNMRAKLAEFYLELDRLSEAEEEIGKIMAQDREHKKGLLVKAKMLTLRNQFDETLELLDNLIIKDPSWGEVYYQKAFVYLKMGDLVLAKKFLDRATEINPEEPRYHALFASLHFKKNDFQSARQEANLALRRDPGNLQAALTLGKSLLYLRKYEEAQELFETMNSQLVGNIDVLHYLGITYLAQRQPDKALKLFAEVLYHKTGYIPSLTIMADTLLRKGKRNEVLSLLQKQAELNPDNAEIDMLLGNFFLQQGSYGEALLHFKKAKQLAPDNPNPYIMIAKTLKKTGSKSDIVQQYYDILGEESERVSTNMGMGTLLELSGDIDGAKDAYLRVLKRDPNYAPAANNLAWLISNHEAYPDLDEALRLAILARKHLPGDPNINDTLGWVHFKRGFHHLAGALFAQSAGAMPTNPLFHYHLALALKEQGEKDQAKESLERALELEGDFEERAVAEKLLRELDGL